MSNMSIEEQEKALELLPQIYQCLINCRHMIQGAREHSGFTKPSYTIDCCNYFIGELTKLGIKETNIQLPYGVDYDKIYNEK
jgi:hypothetical protein